MEYIKEIEFKANPQEFVRLCNLVFAEKWGEDFVPVSDDQGDEGNDGYLETKKRLFAIHCFKNPHKSKSASEILKKAKSDFNKALKLKDALQINEWCFVTAYTLPNDVFIKLNKMVVNNGMAFKTFSSHHIDNELQKKPHLVKAFPWLHENNMANALSELTKKLEKGQYFSKKEEESIAKSVGTKTSEATESKTINMHKAVGGEKKEFSEDYKTVIRIAKYKDPKKAMQELKNIVYLTEDNGAAIQAILTYVDFFQFGIDDIKELTTLLNYGIDKANNMGAADTKSVILAEKASIVSHQFVMMDIEGAFRVDLDNIMGVRSWNEGERNEFVAKLKALNVEAQKLFAEALKLSVESNNYVAISTVLMKMGASSGQKYPHLMHFGVLDRAETEREICRSAFLAAKDLSINNGDRLQLAYVYYNFANAIRHFGETNEAIQMLEAAITEAKSLGQNELAARFGLLKPLIENDVKEVKNEGTPYKSKM